MRMLILLPTHDIQLLIRILKKYLNLLNKLLRDYVLSGVENIHKN